MKETVSSLIEKLRTKPNGRQFASMFDDGDITDYASVAAAELALCKIIALETIDPNLIDGVFQESALYRPRTWNRDRYSDNVIQQAIAAAKASKGIPPFIVQTTRKGKTKDKVSEPLLAQWVRQNVEYRFVKDSATHNMTVYLYEDGVFREIDDKTFEGIIKSPIAQYDITLVDMRQASYRCGPRIRRPHQAYMLKQRHNGCADISFEVAAGLLVYKNQTNLGYPHRRFQHHAR